MGLIKDLRVSIKCIILGDELGEFSTDNDFAVLGKLLTYSQLAKVASGNIENSSISKQSNLICISSNHEQIVSQTHLYLSYLPIFLHSSIP